MPLDKIGEEYIKTYLAFLQQGEATSDGTLKKYPGLPIYFENLFGFLEKTIKQLSCPNLTDYPLHQLECLLFFSKALSTTKALLKIMQGNAEQKGAVVSGLQALNLGFHTPSDPLKVEWVENMQVCFIGVAQSQIGRLEYVMGIPWVAEPVFFVLRDLMDDCRKFWRIVCAITYYVAFGLLAVALIIQMTWAIRGLLLGV